MGIRCRNFLFAGASGKAGFSTPLKMTHGNLLKMTKGHIKKGGALTEATVMDSMRKGPVFWPFGFQESLTACDTGYCT